MAGYRIYADGRYESRPAGQPWQFQNSLDPAQLRQVHEAIARAGFENLAPHYRPDKSIEDPGLLWFQVVRGEKSYSIAIENGCRVPEIDALSADLVALFKEK